MKILLLLLVSISTYLTPQQQNMIELLKTHIKNKDAEQIIMLINKYPEVLNITDENGSSGLLLIAYSGLHEPLEEAIKLKASFTFHEAIVCGQMNIVNDYLNNPEVDLKNTHSKDGFSPLSLAAFFDQTEIAKLLIQFGADPNLSATNPSKVNALHSAIAKENYELCKLFIEKGVNVNATQTQNVTALHSAAHRGNLALVQLLVDHNASINIKMDNGDNALLIAQREGHSEVADYLKEQGN
ncbi:ankyrin repeat domain-containing protein [Portibacter marinus]|uniref:ankyrin repeat domain-containing protein n=1 Tax=Portibacter marinus TaxID=2898660 RepID=UPI001F2C61B7|nr:ankyrin repeat domain-containing protein [Portibacter marinus]